MPEAAIDKDGDTLFREGEVGMTGEGPATSPAGELVFPHEGDEAKFSPGVAVAADGSHVAGTFFRRVDVSHSAQPFAAMQKLP